MFCFEYSDDAGRKHRVMYDGKERVNNVYRDGKLLGLFPRETFVQGRLRVRRGYYQTDLDFENGLWKFGDEAKTNIKIV